MQILAILVGLGSLVCWILVLIQIFQKDSILLGILGILCPLFAFIYGWVKAAEWAIQNIMLVWSVLVVAGLVLNLAVGVSVIPGR